MSKSQFRSLRALGALSLFGCFVTAVVGCADDETGTDIIVGDGGDGGKSSGSGGRNSGGKNGGANSSGSNMGGAPDGGAGESGGGESGSSSSGGSAGTSGGGNGGASAGSGGGGTGGGGTGGGGTGGTGGIGGGGVGGGGVGGGGTAGTGTVVACDTPTAECEAPSSPLCSSSCELVSTQECVDCENAGDCFEFVENCQVFEEAGDRELCYDVMQCVQLSNCYDGTNALGFCFCGSIPAASCGSAPLTGPGSPDGDCADLIVEGVMPVATSAQVLGLLTATSKPAGGALARLQCQKVANMSACREECGVDTEARFPPLPE